MTYRPKDQVKILTGSVFLALKKTSHTQNGAIRKLRTFISKKLSHAFSGTPCICFVKQMVDSAAEKMVFHKKTPCVNHCRSNTDILKF